MRRREWLALQLQKQQRPNILYIMTDQQHAGMMSVTGNPWLQTPNMDRLAKSGVRFELAYASNPVCMPARTSMMTGYYPSHFNMRTNGPADVPEAILPHTLGNLFRNAGYATAFGGKTHWPKPMTPATLGFDYLTRDERDELADRCAAFIQQKHEKPWLLVASFINPHDICYMAIDAHAAATKPASPPLPNSIIERQRVREAAATYQIAKAPPLPANHAATKDEPEALGQYGGFRGWARQNWTVSDWRRHRWAYARLTERVDTEVGRVLAALESSGQLANTVVVFSSDHGDMDSAHGFEHKSLPYEESARVPFIVSWPGHAPAGRIDRRHLVNSCVDLLPTLCDYAGITPPAGLPGRSVRPLVETGKAAQWRQELVIECDNSRTLRTPRYKYTVFASGSRREMLLDLDKDPGETTNLAPDPKAAKILADHRRRLSQQVAALGDAFGQKIMSGLA